MTCVKTGARVHFYDYGQTISADVFKVGNCTIVRTHADQVGHELFSTFANEERRDLTITAPMGAVNQFWRTDVGVFVVPDAYVVWHTAPDCATAG
jgi:hypothetical protein